MAIRNAVIDRINLQNVAVTSIDGISGAILLEAGSGINIVEVDQTITISSPDAGGTVTSVAVSGSNGIGVSGSPITTSGTIALSLGNITPSSVAASGALSGSNFSGSSSGTNTGDQDLSGLVPYTGATGSVNLGTYGLTAHNIKGDASDGLLIEANNGTDIGILGAGNTANATWYGSHNFNAATQDTIAAFIGSGKTLSSLATATYPSLTELSYVKGVTSGIQAQLDGKVTANAGITGATKTKITYDSKGLVTAGADATTSDIGEGTNLYFTDERAQDAVGAMVDTTLVYVDGTPLLTRAALAGDITASQGSNTTTLATVNSNVGSFGSASSAVSFTVNAKGLVTAASATAIGITASQVSDFNTAVRTNRLDQMAAPTASVSLNSQKVVNLLDPTAAQDAATKYYVDSVASGLSIKTSCQLATAAVLPTNTYSNGASGVGATLTGVATGVLTVDGVTVALNDRILVKDEVTQANNGIYTCTVAGAIGVAYVLTRATDNDTSADIAGAFTFVENGTTNSAAGFVVGSAGPFTVGTTAIVWTQFSGAGQIIAGSGLTKTGNTLDVNVDNASIEINADTLRVKASGVTNAMLAGSIDATKINTGVVSNAEFNYLDGVTSAIQTQLDNKQPLDATLTALAAYSTNGLLTQTAADTFTGRTITGTSNRLDVTNGNGVSGNPTLDISSAYVGQTSITTLGTIATGTWQATAIGGSYINYNTTNLKVTSTQLNTIQDIATSSSPTFGGLSVTGLTTITRTSEQLRLSYDLSKYCSFTIGSGGQLTIAPTGNATYLNGELFVGYVASTSGGVYITKTSSYGKPSLIGLTSAFGSDTLYLNPTGGNVGLGGGISVGASYYSTTPPSNGAIIEGNVGIGVSSPNALLHIRGSGGAANGIRIDHTGVGGASIYSSGSYTYLRDDGGNGFYFNKYDDTNYVTISSVGRLGVGTTSPDTLLHAKYTAAGDNWITIESTNSGGGTQNGLRLKANGITTGWDIYTGSTANNSNALGIRYNGGNDFLTLTTAGSLTLTTASGIIGQTARSTDSGSGVYTYLFLGNNTAANKLILFVNSSNRTADGGAGNSTIRVDSGDLILGGSLATNATTGFLYIPTCGGTPTGTPASGTTSNTSNKPIIFDTTNNKLYIYNGGWKSVTLT